MNLLEELVSYAENLTNTDYTSLGGHSWDAGRYTMLGMEPSSLCSAYSALCGPGLMGIYQLLYRKGGAGLFIGQRSGQGRMKAGGRQGWDAAVPDTYMGTCPPVCPHPQTMHGQGLQEGRIAETPARAPMRPLIGGI